MEIAREIKDTENALKEFVAAVLARHLGASWMDICGLEASRTDKWLKLKFEAETQKNPAQVKELPVFYAPLKDIRDLINQHWEKEFYAVFGDNELMAAYLKILRNFRDPDIARRELFIFEKHLVLGVTGDIRNRIANHRSFMELGKAGFPRIESIKDNYGNVWTVGKPTRLKTPTSLRVGDVIEFVITAIDPEQGALQYRIMGFKWESGNILRLPVEENLIGAETKINLTIKSVRKHHAYPLGYDDRVVFQYRVLPVSGN